ncbi:MAG: hypothetical protein PHR37_04020, partial [Eubacteriales bacterium]|nr:hypothetical protein [Eubacteriales bacterium]
MKSEHKKKSYDSANLRLRVAAQNGTGDSFFYSHSWQALRRFLFCFLFSLSLLPLWMKAFNLEVDYWRQGLVLLATYAFIYLILRFSKVL